MPSKQLEGVDRRKYTQFHRRLQRIRNISSGFVPALLAAAVAGAFGSGPLNRVTSGSEVLTAEYPRILRLSAPAEIEFHLTANRAGQTAELSINESYIHALEIIAVTPSPSDMRSTEGRIVYGFHHSPGKSATVLFRIKPLTTGPLAAEVMTQQGASVRFRQLVLP